MKDLVRQRMPDSSNLSLKNVKSVKSGNVSRPKKRPPDERKWSTLALISYLVKRVKLMIQVPRISCLRRLVSHARLARRHWKK
jgi:hypothetical protein